MLRLAMLLMVFSPLFLVGCDDERPDADICIANVKKLSKGCFNLLHDYDQTGHITPGAKGVTHVYGTVDEFLAAVDKNATLDPVSLARVKTWAQNQHTKTLSASQIASEAQARLELEDARLDDLSPPAEASVKAVLQ